MKSRLLSLTALALASFAAAPGAAASPAADRAAHLLATQGSIAVQAAGPYVECGSFRVHVAAHLGRPDATLPDGTWIYHQRAIAGSDATGSLIVRFDARGRVQALSLGTPAHVAALQRQTLRPDGQRLAQH